MIITNISSELSTNASVISDAIKFVNPKSERLDSLKLKKVDKDKDKKEKEKVQEQLELELELESESETNGVF